MLHMHVLYTCIMISANSKKLWKRANVHTLIYLISNLPFYNELNKILKLKKLGAKEFKEQKLGVLNFFRNLHTSDVFRPCSLAF